MRRVTKKQLLAFESSVLESHSLNQIQKGPWVPETRMGNVAPGTQERMVFAFDKLVLIRG